MKCGKPAVFSYKWSKPEPQFACEKHARQAAGLAKFMGWHFLTMIPYIGEEVCQNEIGEKDETVEKSQREAHPRERDVEREG